MATLFCCDDIKPFRPMRVEHELKFSFFLTWSRFPRSASPYVSAVKNEDLNSVTSPKWSYALQLVRQVNYGPLESKRYFVPQDEQKLGSEKEFEEVFERDLIEANFSKVNTYKNFRCEAHNKFFEMNLYMKDPVNKHHWRVNIARPAVDIDLVAPGDSMPAPGSAVASNPKSSAAIKGSEIKEKVAVSKTNTISTSTTAETMSFYGIHSSSQTSASDRDETKSSDEGENHLSSYDHGYHSEDDGAKDYTACSLECGYCGDCDY